MKIRKPLPTNLPGWSGYRVPEQKKFPSVRKSKKRREEDRRLDLIAGVKRSSVIRDILFNSSRSGGIVFPK